MEDNYWEDRFKLFKKLFTNSLGGLVIADVGCGTGGFSTRVVRKDNFVVFCDYGRPNVIATAKRLAISGFSTNSFGVVADARYLPFKSDAFDFVACLEVLEHVGEEYLDKSRTNDPETTKAAKELKRIVKFEKPLFILVPNKAFPVEIHSKVPFGNYLPFFMKRSVGLFLPAMRLSYIEYIPDNFTKNGLLRYFKEMHVERIGAWTRHIPFKIASRTFTLSLPCYGLYLVAEKKQH